MALLRKGPKGQALAPEEKLRKKYKRLRLAFAALLLLFCFHLYFSYNYWIYKFLIASNYVYTDSLDAIYAQALGPENVKGYLRNFDQVMISLVSEKIRQTGGDRYTYLYTPQSYQLSKEVEKADADNARMTALTKDTVYLRIPNFTKYTRKFVYDHKEELAPYQNLVLDLRSNYGGLLSDFYKIAELFLDKGKILGYEYTRLPLFQRTIVSGGETYFHYRKIVILQNKDTASSAEGLILSLRKNLDNVTLVGQTTFGKGIGQITLPLTDGYAAKATVLLLRGPDGVSIHGVGIPPDVEYAKDDILDYALLLAEGE